MNLRKEARGRGCMVRIPEVCNHDAIDRRAHLDLDRDYVRLLHLEGMARTINQLLKEDLI